MFAFTQKKTDRVFSAFSLALPPFFYDVPKCIASRV